MNQSNTLAILGGLPVRETPVPHYNTIGAEEKKAVMDVLDSGELSGFIAYPGKEFWGGPRVQALEARFREMFGVKHALSVNSATSGLHAALSAMSIGPGDEVIVPPYTMSASATMVLMCGAVPIFADIDAETFCIDPASVEANITPQTKGIVAVNLYGQPAPLNELQTIATRHGLFILEDNAQAPAATLDGRFTGTIGDAGVFSFNRHKTMQSGEGGVIVTNDDRIAEKVALFRNHGEVVVRPMGITDLVNAIGVNYRMTEMEAAVALCQLEKLKGLNAHRVSMADYLNQELVKTGVITPPAVRTNATHVYYFYAMKFDSEKAGLPRDLFAKAVSAEGVPLRPGYLKPLYLEPLYQKKICFGPNGFPFTANPRYDTLPYAPGTCPTCERLEESELIITPFIFPPLDRTDMDQFIEACSKVLQNRDALLAHADKL